MNGPEFFERKEAERRFRRTVFHSTFAGLTIFAVAFFTWKLRSLLVPIMVGALLAYLFRPLKDRFRVKWLPHELRVITLFAFIGLLIFMGVNSLRKQMPNERQKVELKVRLQYKLNQKFEQLVGNGKSAMGSLVAKEAGPMMDKINQLLDLAPDEHDQFALYRRGYNGETPTEQRFVDYYEANKTKSVYSHPERDPSAVLATQAAETGGEAHAEKISLMEELSIWILAPIIFVFLGFDHGQMRRSFIALVPNRYFELSLTVLDMLDEAIGNYLRGTLLECGLVGFTLALGFWLLGIPLAMAGAIGVISGLANAIPFLGTVIGLIIGLGYALIAENITPVIPGISSNDLALYVIILIAITHVLDNVIYQPFVLGSAVNLHPLVVMLAIIGGSLLLGVWGMLFAIPAVVVVKTAVETLFKELKDYRII